MYTSGMARYDLHFQAVSPDDALSTTKIFTFGYADTLGVRGFQMLINLWLKVFFTRRGSDPTNLERGTAFTNLIGSNTALSEAEDIVRVCVEQTNDQVRAIQQNDTTLLARERLADAKLYRYTSDPTAPGFQAYVEILNEAGERLKVNIPDFSRG